MEVWESLITTGEIAMDGQQAALERKFERLLQELSVVGEQLRQAKRPSDKLPHYFEIEQSAHQMGQRLSRALQREASVETALEAGDWAACPGCGQDCRLRCVRRTITTTDGLTEISEPVGDCDRCGRSFFPSTPSAGPR